LKLSDFVIKPSTVLEFAVAIFRAHM